MRYHSLTAAGLAACAAFGGGRAFAQGPELALNGQFNQGFQGTCGAFNPNPPPGSGGEWGVNWTRWALQGTPDFCRENVNFHPAGATYAQEIGKDFMAYKAGLYQQIPVIQGVPYTISVWIYVTSSEQGLWNVERGVVVDLLGRATPALFDSQAEFQAGNVVAMRRWDNDQDFELGSYKQFAFEVVPKANTITLATWIWNKWNFTTHSVHDDVSARQRVNASVGSSAGLVVVAEEEGNTGGVLPVAIEIAGLTGSESTAEKVYVQIARIRGNAGDATFDDGNPAAKELVFGNGSHAANVFGKQRSGPDGPGAGDRNMNVLLRFNGPAGPILHLLPFTVFFVELAGNVNVDSLITEPGAIPASAANEFGLTLRDVYLAGTAAPDGTGFDRLGFHLIDEGQDKGFLYCGYYGRGRIRPDAIPSGDFIRTGPRSDRFDWKRFRSNAQYFASCLDTRFPPNAGMLQAPGQVLPNAADAAGANLTDDAHQWNSNQADVDEDNTADNDLGDNQLLIHEIDTPRIGHTLVPVTGNIVRRRINFETFVNYRDVRCSRKATWNANMSIRRSGLEPGGIFKDITYEGNGDNLIVYGVPPTDLTESMTAGGNPALTAQTIDPNNGLLGNPVPATINGSGFTTGGSCLPVVYMSFDQGKRLWVVPANPNTVNASATTVTATYHLPVTEPNTGDPWFPARYRVQVFKDARSAEVVGPPGGLPGFLMF